MTTTVEQIHRELLKDSVESIWNIKPQRFIHTQRCFTMFRNLKNTFKIISVLSLVLLTTFFIKPDVALAGGFGDTCTNVRGEETKTEFYLIATCKKKNGKTAVSQLDLSQYIANHNGKLSWSPGEGGFLKTCYEPSIMFGLGKIEDTLYATCNFGENDLSYVSISLEDYISNQDGVLTPKH